MKKVLTRNLLLLTLAIAGCGKDEVPFNFLSCQLTTVEYSGSMINIETYTYDDAGNMILLEITETGSSAVFYSEAYEYSGAKLIKITSNNWTRQVEYESGKVSKVIEKDLGGNLISTTLYEWSNKVLTVITKDASSVDLYSTEYTFNGKDVIHEVYTDYYGGEISFTRELDYSEFDGAYNPEYIQEYPFPASLHNYNHINVTDTDYSGVTPVVNNFTYDYQVTINASNAVMYRKRTRSDNAELLERTYTYAKCN